MVLIGKPIYQVFLDSAFKKKEHYCAGARTHTHTYTHPLFALPGSFGCHEMRGELNSSGLPDGEPERPSRNRWAEDDGVLGMRE